jgi:hypothetical protein
MHLLMWRLLLLHPPPPPTHPPPPQTEDLLAKTAANKAINDKARLATSSANLARSR